MPSATAAILTNEDHNSSSTHAREGNLALTLSSREDCVDTLLAAAPGIKTLGG